ncbi:uncharacterized protein LOC115891603 [Sitophilus oryzae]|uniref:Uncharacterized protein LOC115891603 n=1 Tax=Sitophilus oryzae TaxID=7048 RepID=A0A6J2YYR7_SITOR|nr:uncharacterized protein LOC115891603 [Sitophilus oryzae]
MACVDLNSAVCDAFSVPHDTKFNFTLKKCINDVETLVLDITNNDKTQNQYLAVPGADILEENFNHKVENNLVIHPIFTFRHTDNKNYTVFDMEKLKSHVAVEKNNYEHLNIILKSLAEYQAHALSTQSKPLKKVTVDLEELFARITLLLEKFKDIDRSELDGIKTRLQACLNKFLDSDLVVRSVGCPSGKNVFLDLRKRQAVFLNKSKECLVPPVYDALLYILAFTDENFRQLIFFKLLGIYFDSLVSSLEQLTNISSSKITQAYRATTVRILLPIVKFQIATTSDLAEELASNILRFLKYSFINQEDIYEILENRLNSKAYELIDYEMINLNKKTGHLGQYFDLKIKFAIDGDITDLTLFAKVLVPLTEFLSEAVEEVGENEDFFYTTLIPLYREHGLERLLSFAPRCYLSRPKWMLVLDNTNDQGFETIQLNKNLNNDGLRAILSNLAKFVAATLIVEENLSRAEGKPVRIDDLYPEQFIERMFIDDKDNKFAKLISNTKVALLYLIELIPEVTDTFNLSQEEIRRTVDEMFQIMYTKILKSPKFRNAIIHGDMHLGNMMFQHNKEGLITESILVDFQGMRYIPPAFEVLHFINANSTRNTRLKYKDQLIEEYYENVARYLAEFGHDPEEVFPRESFSESLKYLRSAGLIMELFYGYLMKMDPEKREEVFLDQEKFTYYCIENIKALIDYVWEDDNYRTNMQDIVQDILEYITDQNQ